MNKNIGNLIEINKNEVLRYLEYKNQNIDEKLNNIIEDCIKATKDKINPRYTFGVYSILNKDGYQIKFKDTNISIISEDLSKLLSNCTKCIIIVTTLGVEIDNEIKRNSYSNLTKSIILDACATTAIEELCDLLENHIKSQLSKDGKYITKRYSPGYGDLSIDINKDIINLLNTQITIGLTITKDRIMIPRKSVIAIIGVSENKVICHKKSCIECSNHNTCKYKKGG